MSEQQMVMTQAQRSTPRIESRYRVKKYLTSTLTHLFLILVAVLMIFPLLWLVSTSLKAPNKQMI